MNWREQRSPAQEGMSIRQGRSSHEEVDGIQCARIISAMVEVAFELGYAGAAVAPVVARAGVSRRTFYELFDGREGCFLAAFEWGVEEARKVVAEASRGPRSWRERVRHVLAALLRFLDAEPRLARLLVIEALGAGKLVLARRSEILHELVEALDASAPRPRSAGQLAALTAEGAVGGVFSVIHEQLLEQRIAEERDEHGAPARPEAKASKGAGALIELHGRLMALIALPYLGARAAGEELTRSVPDTPPLGQRAPAGAEGGGQLIARLQMRLTYRTVRCLLFVGENPGASNRAVAQGAEILDEGQASKLLGRLANTGLIANSSPPGPGQPNRWELTAGGRQVLSSVNRVPRPSHLSTRG